nr:MAG TPA: hypothetical protein [Caudoviricetes sp.]
MTSEKIFNNTDIDLSKRISIERYYNFLCDKIPEIFSYDGINRNGDIIKFSDTVANALDENGNVSEELNEVLNKIRILNHDIESYQGSILSKKGIKYNITGLSYSEINISNTGQSYLFYRYFYIFTIKVAIFNEENVVTNIIHIPFVVVKSSEGYKALIYPFANKLAKYEIEEDFTLMDISFSTIPDLLDLIFDSLSPNDFLFTAIINNIEKDRYSFRPNEEDMANVIDNLHMDSRVISYELSENESYPDTPIITLKENPDGINLIDDIMVTDSFKFSKVDYEEYKKNMNLKAVIIRMNDKDVSILDYPIRKLIPLGYNLHEELNLSPIIENGKIVEKNIFHPVNNTLSHIGESYGYEIISLSSSGYGEAGSAKEIGIKNKDLDKLSSISEIAVDTFRKAIELGKVVISKITRAVDEVRYATYVNDFLGVVFTALRYAIPHVGLLLLFGPLVSITFSVLQICYNANAHYPSLQEKEIAKVEQNFQKRVAELQEVRAEYEAAGNKRVVARIDRMIKEYNNKFENIRLAREEKQDLKG